MSIFRFIDLARITLLCHSRSAVVNDKACRSASLYEPRPTDRPTDLFFAFALFANALTDFTVIQTLPETSWNRLGPGFVKKSYGKTGKGGDPPSIPTKNAIALHNSKLL